MMILFAILFALSLGFAIFLLTKNKRLEDDALRTKNEAQASVTEAQNSAYQKITAMQQESQTAVVEAQKLIDQQFAEMQQESERVRQHYETESRKNQEAAAALVAKTIQELEPLRKFEKFRGDEAEAQRQLADALKEATSLRAEAQNLMKQSKTAAADECSAAEEKAKDIHEQADARLNQAIRDAGRIMADAEKRAEQIGGDAYRALREKDMLAQAADAIRNKIEGYGDRYLVPAHSVLDDLADKFGYDAAGQALKSARALSARMVEQVPSEAATCDYVKDYQQKTAIQFVIHAFNGEVDSILSKVMSDNSGTLAQKIRDAYSTVNKDGSAFRNARILPAYLDARLAELDSAVRMREFVQKVRDEQRAEREKMRDAALAEKEHQEKQREAEKEQERAANDAVKKKLALEAAERSLAAAKTAEQNEQLTRELNQARRELDAANQQLAEATQKRRAIPRVTGSIYIISNEGSFGAGKYKIGFTRRDPETRVEELYNASVPFEFEVHGVITTTPEDAPGIENRLHKEFVAYRWNKKNFGKEFFVVDLKDIRQTVEKLAQEKDFPGKISWRQTEAGRAAEWQYSRQIENDLEAKKQWEKRAIADADENWRKRERRLAKRRELGASDSDAPETNADDEGA
jgi:hypothetical protein